MWALPRLHADIARHLSGDAAPTRHLAKFSMYAHKHGMPIADKPFVTVQETISRQIQDYADAQFAARGLAEAGSGAYCRLELGERFDGNASLMFGHTGDALPVARVKRSYERLEAQHRGLGRFLLQALRELNSLSIYVYGFDRVFECASYTMFHGVETNAAMLEEFNGHSDEGEQVDVQGMAEQVHLLPTDVVRDAGAMALNSGMQVRQDKSGEPEDVHGCDPNKVLAPAMPAARVKALLQGKAQALDAADAKALKAALEIKQLLAQRRRARAAEKAAGSRVLETNQDEERMYCDLLGAIGFVVWDSPEMTMDIVEHYEQNVQQGECTDVYLDLLVCFANADTWPHLLKRIKFEIDTLACSSQLLQALSDAGQIVWGGNHQSAPQGVSHNAPQGAKRSSR